MKKKIRKPAFNTSRKELDFYWAVLVKARAGFQSELSEQAGELHAHHLRGKSSYSLRYSLLNGICCTAGEHKFGFHHQERAPQYEEKVKTLRGKKIFDSLALLKNEVADTIPEIREYLLKELKKHEPEIKEYFEEKGYKNYNIIKQWKHLFNQLERIK